MTKEQEAIENLENLSEYGLCYTINEKIQEDIETVLNMLKEKDKEIQFLKDINKQEKDRHKQAEKSLKGQIKKKDEELKMYKELKDIANSKVTELVKLKQYDDLKKKVDRQDKMIDLMAEALVKVPNNEDNLIIEVINRNLEQKKEEVKQYFERKVENGN